MKKLGKTGNLLVLIVFYSASSSYGFFWGTKKCPDAFERDYNKVVHEKDLLDMDLKAFGELPTLEAIEAMETHARNARALAAQLKDKYKGFVCKATIDKEGILDPVEVTINVKEKMDWVIDVADKVSVIVEKSGFTKHRRAE